MSAADTAWEFDVAVEPEIEDVEPPTRDDVTRPDKRVEGFAYECGYFELRSARNGEWIHTDKPMHTGDFR